MIRRAIVSDFVQCNEIALQCASLYPDLRPSLGSIKKLFDECVSGARNFAVVSEHEGKIVGCLFAISYDHLWAQKQSSSVLLWHCEASGDGISMLKQYRAWVDSRPAIRRAGFQFDCEINGRVFPVLERCGFKKIGGCHLRLKGV
jgi:hypothetical protein